MLKIRLARTGKKDKPSYRIVIAEHSSPIQGKFVCIVGHYNPFDKVLVLKKDEIKKWLKNGAKPSNTVAKLLTREGMKHPSIVVKTFNKKAKSKDEDGEAKKDSKPAEKKEEPNKPETTDKKAPETPKEEVKKASPENDKPTEAKEEKKKEDK